jgi:HD-GYP domain-containing protein (c-di-GMP phosphodiesterase class II)
VHVCDVYDALRTKRPYRDAWESERVLAYIAERAGTEFEPDAANAFVTMMRKAEKGIQLSPMSGPDSVATGSNGNGSAAPARPETGPPTPPENKP